MMRFLDRVGPAYVLSFHQPLHAVDITERPAFSRRVARALGLPASRLDCGSTCHGTMTMWFNHRFAGFALTVEYGATPSAAKLRRCPRRDPAPVRRLAWRRRRRRPERLTPSHESHEPQRGRGFHASRAL